MAEQVKFKLIILWPLGQGNAAKVFESKDETHERGGSGITVVKLA